MSIPYEYGVSKAYELTSCFEGLLEYYLATGIEKYKTAVLNYASAVLSSEMSIIGGSGVTHELFDHTRTRQTVDYDGVKQETCVTVTLMKFFSRMLELTGDSAYADAIERSFYNGYLGALNAEHCESEYMYKTRPGEVIVSSDLAFDSYSPLIPAKRGQVVGGNQVLPDGSYYGCCACIGSAGVGIFLKNAVTLDEDGIRVNFYERGRIKLTYRGTPVEIEMDTEYPVSGRIKLRVTADVPVKFTLRLRNPGWADGPKGYTAYTRVWRNDELELNFDMPIRLHYPEEWEEDVIYTDMSCSTAYFQAAGPMTVYHRDDEDDYIAVTRGPLTLAADSRTGKSADSVFDVPTGGEVCENSIIDGVPCLLKMRFTPEAGEPYYLVNYAHAGRDWDTVIAAWLRTKNEKGSV